MIPGRIDQSYELDFFQSICWRTHVSHLSSLTFILNLEVCNEEPLQRMKEGLLTVVSICLTGNRCSWQRQLFLKCLLFLFSGLMYNVRRLLIFWSGTILSMNPFFSLFMGANPDTFSQCYQFKSNFHSYYFKIKNNPRKHY